MPQIGKRSPQRISGRARITLENLRRLEPWQGSKRLARFLLNLYLRPRSQEERLRSLGAKIGAEVQLQPFSVDERYARLLTIEDEASIGKGSTIHLSDSLLNTGSASATPPPVLFGPVRISRRAVVGRNVIILPGVTIGEDAIVGAGSVVTRDVPAGQVAAGVPARVLGSVESLEKSRFSEERIREDRKNIYIHMPNWRHRRRLGMRPEEQEH
ncbi:MAG: acyltransferase, partial [Acidobacteria bacterium]|nr:acyltransferase [Acidobacteriota bacterium]